MQRSDEEELKDQIPPGTYRRLNDYFIRAQREELFWRGTHWSRIATTLEELRAVP